jgi:hypothetical protein
MRKQCFENPELDHRQCNLGSVPVCLEVFNIHRQPFVSENRDPTDRSDGVTRPASQYSPHPGYELARAKGFCDVVIESVNVEFLLRYLWLVIVVFVIALWLLVSLLISVMGGWRALSGYYTAETPFPGERIRFCSAQFARYVNYGNCLTLGAGPQGLYVAILPVLRVAHPPLLIPWEDITAREAQTWLFAAIELEFAKVPSVRVRLPSRLAQRLFDASGTQVLVNPAG